MRTKEYSCQFCYKIFKGWLASTQHVSMKHGDHLHGPPGKYITEVPYEVKRARKIDESKALEAKNKPRSKMRPRAIKYDD